MNMRFAALLFAAASILLAPSSRADVTPASPFTDHLVLQRDRPVPVWGSASPGEAVSVTFGAQQAKTRADAKGAWSVALNPLPASAEPAELILAGATNTVVLKDVLVGDVWLCSGQSNMGWELRQCTDGGTEVSNARYPSIRAFTAGYKPGAGKGYLIRPGIAEKLYALEPQNQCLGAWKVCTPDNAKNFSGVAYFFGRHLHKELNVPIGLLISSMGATAIEAWTSVEGLKAVPAYHERAAAYEELALAYMQGTNRFLETLAEQKQRYPARLETWFKELDKEEPGLASNWMAPATPTAGWSRIALPVTVEDNPLGVPVASIWFRKDVTVPADWAGRALDLRLGVLDAVDEVYVNGVKVGRTWFDAPGYWLVSRQYAVPASAVSGTTLTVTLRLLKLAYPMGVFGPATNMTLSLAGSTDAPVPLAGDWLMKKACDLDPGRQPQLSPSGTNFPGTHYGMPAAMYNGLIRPLIPYAIRGAIWYQGEANAPFYADYKHLLPGLIRSWRKEWGQGDFAFGVIQLADYWGQQTRPVERAGYTPLREAQTSALQLTNTFIATAVGVGEGNNIHPKNKQEVGRRLALAALGTAYGQTNRLYVGPVLRSMEIEGNAIRLHFNFAKGLHARGEPPVGFAVAGEDRTYYTARARIEGETVVVSSEKVAKPVAVRYAWSTNPVCNLYNGEELPILQFHTDNWDVSQIIITDDPVVIPGGWTPK